ncbi:MAG: spermidine synthase [Caulobacteraceae bacterium]
MRILLEETVGSRQILVLEQRRDGSRLYLDGGVLYTHVDSHGNNLLHYIGAMKRVLAEAPDVLLLGTAGGALATELSRMGAAVTAVDNWLRAFDIAREWFHLPPTVECAHDDAVTFLRQTARQWSAIAIDVFQGTCIPDSILTSDVAALLVRRTKPNGLIVWNIANALDARESRWIAKALQLQGLTPTTVSVLDADVGNTLIVCRNLPNAAASAEPTNALARSSPGPRKDVDSGKKR